MNTPLVRSSPKPNRSARRRRKSSAFTLVELMIALTGGLAFTVFVFMMTRDVTRFFQEQTRSSDATIAAIGGYQRLRADVARAGFLSSPNLAKDPNRCPPPIGGNVLNGINGAGWVARPLLQQLALARVTVGGSLAANASNTMLTGNSLSPDQLDLYGNYTSVDQFPVRRLVPSTGQVDLNDASNALLRAGYGDAADQAGRELVLSTLFPTGRILRIVDPMTGKEQYTEITGVDAATATNPFITFDVATVPLVEKAAGNTCGITGYCDQCLVNTVNIVRYELANLNNVGTYPQFQFLFEDVDGASFNAQRLDLVRSEVLSDGTVQTASSELVAEFAVDFKIALTAVTDPALGTIGILAEGNADIPRFAGVSTGTTASALNSGPHLIRGIRPRLAVRARAPDRGANAMNVPGLYRVNLGTTTAPDFARVRTLQSTVATRNARNRLWQ